MGWFLSQLLMKLVDSVGLKGRGLLVCQLDRHAPHGSCLSSNIPAMLDDAA